MEWSPSIIIIIIMEWSISKVSNVNVARSCSYSFMETWPLIHSHYMHVRFSLIGRALCVVQVSTDPVYQPGVVG